MYITIQYSVLNAQHLLNTAHQQYDNNLIEENY